MNLIYHTAKLEKFLSSRCNEVTKAKSYTTECYSPSDKPTTANIESICRNSKVCEEFPLLSR